MFGLKFFGKKKAAKEAAPEDSDKEDKEKTSDGDDEASAAEDAAPKKRFGMKFMLIAGGGLLALLIGVGAGAYFFLFSKPKTQIAEATQAAIPLVPPTVAYMDMSNIIVNIQTADGTPAYLKLSVSLELNTPEEKAGLQVLMPRVVDQFQGYLRELRIDDLRGSAGVMRLKEELLRRINVAAAPYRVRDVLLKEMIVQ